VSKICDALSSLDINTAAIDLVKSISGGIVLKHKSDANSDQITLGMIAVYD
jgi:hypothetical protein